MQSCTSLQKEKSIEEKLYDLRDSAYNDDFIMVHTNNRYSKGAYLFERDSILEDTLRSIVLEKFLKPKAKYPKTATVDEIKFVYFFLPYYEDVDTVYVIKNRWKSSYYKSSWQIDTVMHPSFFEKEYYETVICKKLKKTIKSYSDTSELIGVIQAECTANNGFNVPVTNTYEVLFKEKNGWFDIEDEDELKSTIELYKQYNISSAFSLEKDYEEKFGQYFKCKIEYEEIKE